jgi:hypothetical protein
MNMRGEPRPVDDTQLGDPGIPITLSEGGSSGTSVRDPPIWPVTRHAEAGLEARKND